MRRTVKQDASAPTTRELTDEALVPIILAGKTELFANIYERHWMSIYRMIRRMTSDGELARELTQEVFVRVYQNLAKFGFRSKFSTWLYRVAWNFAVGHLRTDKARAEKGTPTGDCIDHNRPVKPRNGEEAFLFSELRQQVHAAVLKLKDSLRTPLILHYGHDLTYAEIGRRLRLPEGTVASRLFRARSILASELADFRSTDTVHQEPEDRSAFPHTQRGLHPARGRTRSPQTN